MFGFILAMLIGNYKTLLKTFIKQKYYFVDFSSIDINKNSQVILRHDIDLDIDIALEMAKIENNLNIKSTYFFLLKNDSYNLLSRSSIDSVLKIKNLGHNISLHFDMKLYNNSKEGLKSELKIFNQTFGEKVNMISIHRPSKDFLENPNSYFAVNNSYEDKINKNISYFADSGGSFKYGNPTNSEAFKNNKNIQLLIHPVWWINSDKSIKKTIDKVIDFKKNKLYKHFKKNISTLS